MDVQLGPTRLARILPLLLLQPAPFLLPPLCTSAPLPIPPPPGQFCILHLAILPFTPLCSVVGVIIPDVLACLWGLTAYGHRPCVELSSHLVDT